MTKIIPFLTLTFLMIITSCSSDQEDDVIITPEIGAVAVSTSNIHSTTADLSWTTEVSGQMTIAYDIYLDGTMIKEAFTEDSLTLDGLTAETDYSGKVMVKGDNGDTKEQTFSFTTLSIANPSSFEIEFEDTTPNSASATWTTPTIDDGTSISYDLYLNDNLIAEDITVNQYDLQELSPNSSYRLKITAKSEGGGETTIEKTLETPGTAPSSFPLTAQEGTTFDTYDPYGLTITWTPPTIEDGSNFSYSIYVDDDLIETAVAQQSNSYTFSDLEENTEYTIKVVAVAENDTETEETIDFRTYTYPVPSGFDVEVTNITGTTAEATWEASTVTNGATVTYAITLNGASLNNNTPITETSYSLGNLSSNTTYTLKVVATTGSGERERTTESESTFTTDYAAHPTMSIEKATLYTKDSSYFGGQVIVKFTQNIEEMGFEAFYAGNIQINNFSTYPSSIASGTLSDSDYADVDNTKTGYVIITDNDVSYKLSFDIVVETN